jgi:hypothetical protein
MLSISKLELKRSIWQTAIVLTLGFWISASLVLDWVIMPSLYLSGMMSQTSFSTAGYVIFWNFNRLELLAAALVLTSLLAICQTQSHRRLNWIALSVMLLVIALVDTYLLSPQMSSVGTQLNLFASENTVPVTMNLLHGSYFILETLKLGTSAILLSWCWREIESGV